MTRATALGILMALLGLGGCDSGQDGPAPAPADSSAPSSASSEIVPLAYHYLGIVRSQRIGSLTLGQASGCADVPGGVCVQSVSADGEERDLASLEGKVVEIDATVLPTSNTATVAIRRAVVGPVDAVDLAHARLTVMGQDVYLYGAGGEGSLLELAVGDVVEVNGYVGVGGQVFATRIDLVDPALQEEPVFLVRGILSVASDGRLKVGGLALDVSGARIEGFPASSPIAGDAVALFGSRRPVAGMFIVDRALFDTKVWPLKGGFTGRELLLQGVVTAMRSGLDFDISGQHVVDQYDYYVAAPAGATMSLLQRVMSNGTVVEVQPNIGVSADVILAGSIEQIDLEQLRITVRGTSVQLLPLTYIGVNPSEVETSRVPFGALKIGDSVEVAGRELGSTIVASSIRVGDRSGASP